MSDSDRWRRLRESIRAMRRNSYRLAITDAADFHRSQAAAFTLVLDEMTTIELTEREPTDG